jgi:disulfide bond formation protein DsbB
LIAAASVLAIATIAGAWGFQLIGGYVPCALCYAQRVPYYVGIPLLLVALALVSRGLPGWAVRLVAIAAALVFAYGMGLGIQQAGAEWGFWEGPRDCATAGAKATTSVNDLLAAMQTTRIVSCTEVQWRFAGLSFAGWNAVVSLALVLLSGAAAWSAGRGSTVR